MLAIFERETFYLVSTIYTAIKEDNPAKLIARSPFEFDNSGLSYF